MILINLFDSIYQTYFSVCALIPIVFMLSLSIIFFSIQNKSKATFHLALAFLYMFLFYVGYLISSTFYHPLAAFHRWLTVSVVMLCESQFILFFLNFPEKKFPTFTKIFGIILYLISFVLTGIFFYKTLNAPTIYHFAGHYWDFDADEISKIIGLVIIGYLILSLIVGIWQTIITKTKERWAVLSISICIFLTISIPASTNTLSREGIIDRGLYQITQDLFNFLGFFIMAIIYINNTKDRTNFMTKILGISLATILLLFQGLSYFSLKDKDKAYDSLQLKDTKYVIDTNIYLKNMKYLISYSIDNGEITSLHNTNSETHIDFNSLKNEYYNTAIYEKINTLNGAYFTQNLQKLLGNTQVYFGGYKNAMLEYVETIKMWNKPNKRLLEYIMSLERKILYAHNKIKKLPDNNFKIHVVDFLNNNFFKTEPFTKAILKHINNNKLDGKDLKNEVLQFLAPMKPAEVRLYRKSASNDHFIAFIKYDKNKNVLYEAGYSYISYRKYLHPFAVMFVIMLAILLTTIVVGFQFFFLGAFVRPLKRLLNGMFQITEGNLNVQIPIDVEDELGYISHNFNTMVETIRTAKEKLDDYAANLEKKVEDRTVELKHANDELEAAMEEMEAINDNLIKTNKELEEAQRIAALDMQMAVNVQTGLFPKNAPVTKEWEISYIFKPMAGISGDMYDFYIEDGNLNGVSLFDVSGHGIASGLITVLAKSILNRKFTSMKEEKLSHIIEEFNNDLIEEIKSVDNYLAGLILRFKDNIIEYVNAGYTDPIHFNSRTGDLKVITLKDQIVKGMFLGIEAMKDKFTILNFKMQKDDYLFIYSDCLLECKNQSGEEFGVNRIRNSFKNATANNTNAFLNRLLRDLYEFNGSEHLADDLTAILIKRLS